jgi:hypothetical protein
MIPVRLGYHHHGIEYWQTTEPESQARVEDTTVQCDPEGEDPRCSLSVPSRGINSAHTRVCLFFLVGVGSALLTDAGASTLGFSQRRRSAFEGRKRKKGMNLLG